MIYTWLMKRMARKEMSRRERRTWGSAKTVPDVAMRTADWLSGDLGYGCGGYDQPDEETEELKPALIAANRAGFATSSSQPGSRWVEDDAVWRQRAFVDGFIEHEAYPEFRDHLTSAGLLVLEDGASIDLTECDCEVVTGASGKLRRWDYSAMLAGTSGAAVRAARHAVFVTVVDERWTKNDLLWPTLEAWAVSRGA